MTESTAKNPRPLRPRWRAALAGLLLAGAVLWGAAPAWAHHSYAMFDRTRQLTVTGLVRIWEFSNPHSYLWVYVKDAQGKYQLYGLEAPGPMQLIRAGWNKNTVRPGDTVTAEIYPLRDGRHGGNLVKLTLTNGRTLNGDGGPGATLPPPAP